MKRKFGLRFVPLIMGAALFAAGLYCCVGLAGPPYQDPTPEMTERYLTCMSAGRMLMTVGVPVMAAGAVIAAAVKRRMKR